jgi:hypothetical protein
MSVRFAQLFARPYRLAFRDALRTGAPFPTEAPDNLETLKIVEDVYRLAG